jgi:hypothetical protein
VVEVFPGHSAIAEVCRADAADGAVDGDLARLGLEVGPAFDSRDGGLVAFVPTPQERRRPQSDSSLGAGTSRPQWDLRPLLRHRDQWVRMRVE